LTSIVYTQRAEDELRAIWRYIAQDHDNEPAADRILLAIGEKIELLRNHPRLGPRRSDIAAGARLLIEGHFLVLYETHPGPADVGVLTTQVSLVQRHRNSSRAQRIDASWSRRLCFACQNALWNARSCG
jgi:toxin ParE1/3/4